MTLQVVLPFLSKEQFELYLRCLLQLCQVGRANTVLYYDNSKNELLFANFCINRVVMFMGQMNLTTILKLSVRHGSSQNLPSTINYTPANNKRYNETLTFNMVMPGNESNCFHIRLFLAIYSALYLKLHIAWPVNDGRYAKRFGSALYSIQFLSVLRKHLVICHFSSFRFFLFISLFIINQQTSHDSCIFNHMRFHWLPSIGKPRVTPISSAKTAES